MDDFPAVISPFSRWLQARKLDPKDYSLSILARDQRALAALQAELNASFAGEHWRPVWERGGVEVHGVTIETKLRDDGKPGAGDKEASVSSLPASIFWPLALAQAVFFGWLVFSSLGWWRL